MRLATAPGTWGIEPPSQPTDPPWTRVLDEIAEGGFDGSELGPLGYYPTDAGALGAALDERGLGLPAGFVMEPLSRDGERVLEVARRTCALVAGAGGTTLVLIDGLDPERSATAGRSETAARLDPARWERLIGTVDAVATIAAEAGLRVGFHPHAGTHVEFEDEIARLMEDADPAVGLCVDTGHSVYSGVDPVALVVRYAARIVHVHLKDLDPVRLAACHAAGGTFEQAVAAQVFTPLGDGNVDLGEVASVLAAQGYDGWATLEQDRVVATIDAALPEARRSLAHVRALGW